MILLASIFVFCIAATFRLLDNSAGLLIGHGISVSPFYLSREEVQHHMSKIEDNPKLIKRLERTLLFQKLHKWFLLFALVCFIGGIIYEFIDPSLIYLF